MTKQKTLHGFMQEQQAINNIADMLRYVFYGDVILENKVVFDELVQKTMDLMKTTDSYEASLQEDEDFLTAVKKTTDTKVENVVADLTFVLLHATIAKQSLMIDKLLDLLDNKE